MASILDLCRQTWSRAVAYFVTCDALILVSLMASWRSIKFHGFPLICGFPSQVSMVLGPKPTQHIQRFNRFFWTVRFEVAVCGAHMEGPVAVAISQLLDQPLSFDSQSI